MVILLKEKLDFQVWKGKKIGKWLREGNLQSLFCDLCYLSSFNLIFGISAYILGDSK